MPNTETLDIPLSGINPDLQLPLNSGELTLHRRLDPGPAGERLRRGPGLVHSGAAFPAMALTKNKALQNYYILPCCLLLLNLVNSIVSYKAGVIGDPFLRTAVVMLLVLFGSSLTAFVVAPALGSAVRWLHQSSRQSAGGLGEVLFFIVLGVVVFWLYYRLSLHGPAAIVPPLWRN
jgi:hypothetical protein